VIAKLRELAERALPDGAARQRIALERACSPANILRLIAVAEAAERVADRWRHHGANATDTAALSAAIDALRKGDGA
jgi:hypothetical protein